jgi:anti-sigma B factor antagonist
MTNKPNYEEPIGLSGPSSGQKKNEQQFDLTCSCGTKFYVSLDIVGDSAPCPKCGKDIKISDKDVMPFTCGCGKCLRIPRSGEAKICPMCKKPVKLLVMPSAKTSSEKSSCETHAVIDTGKIEQAAETSPYKSDGVPQRSKIADVKVGEACDEKLEVSVVAEHHVEPEESNIKVEYGMGITFVTFNDMCIVEADQIEKLKSLFMPIIEKTKQGKLVLNFSNVQSLSSASLGLLVIIHKKIREQGGNLELCNLSQNILKVFKITQLTKVFNISKK